MALNGWHPGERLIHKKLGHDTDYSIMTLYQSIDGDLPSEHAVFHSTQLPFIPITTLDESGRPWGSILAGSDGKPGFVRNLRYSVLSVDAKVWPGEPLLENAKLFRRDGEMLVAGIGIEFPTRRRNKFAGKVTKLEKDGDMLHLDLTVNQALGNCPKYINSRDLVPYPGTSPTVKHKQLRLGPDERLPEDVIAFIKASDTVFLGTTYQALPDEAARYPSHLGMNQRGGREGFIRVLPSDGHTIVLPDYSGNRFMTSLGNIEATPLASLTFISFTTGDILYLTGEATNHFAEDARSIMPLQNALATIRTTGYIYVADALPVRQRPNTTPQPSPYSPPIRLLAEESPSSSTLFPGSRTMTALLTRVVLHNPTIATFTWTTATPLSIVPGQAIIMDFTSLLGAQPYQHMAPLKPTSVNDDRVRTWTVSSTVNHTDAGGRMASELSLTMREKPGGAVTGALFSIARKLAEVRPELLHDTRALGLSVGVVGVMGNFVLPVSIPVPVPAAEEGRGPTNNELGLRVPPLPSVEGEVEEEPVTKLLWLAGGIGITPFLAMFRGLQSRLYDIRVVLSMREPEVLGPLLADALRADGGRSAKVIVDVFSQKEVLDLGVEGVVMRRHKGRVTKAVFEEGREEVVEREVYVCGPEPFEKAVKAMLEDLGVELARIRTEGFAY